MMMTFASGSVHNSQDHNAGSSDRDMIEASDANPHDHYREKYELLRRAYEERITQLTEVVNSTCSKVLTDEVLIELKGDKTSAVFIPAHIADIISSSFQGEREGQIHALQQQIIKMETQNKAKDEAFTTLRQQNTELLAKLAGSEHTIASLTPAAENLQQMQLKYTNYVEESRQVLLGLRQDNEELKLRERQLVNRLEIVKQDLEGKAQLCEQLESRLALKDRDLGTLEQSFEEASRSLALIENIEKQEQLHKAELKELVDTLTEERSALHDENQQLRAKLQYACDELDRCHTLVAQKETDEASSNQRLVEMMEQVEAVLTQEAADSNAAISAVHEKMKAFRQRMSSELQREKRFSAALQEELQMAKTAKEECLRGQQRLKEQDATLREQLAAEQQRGAALTRQLQEEAQQVASLKVRVAELQTQAAKADHLHRDYDRLKALEAQLLQERAVLDTERSRESESLQFEKRMEAYKLHYENELGELRKQLKTAYTFDKNTKASGGADELSYKNTIQSWVQENARLKQRHSAELAMVETRLKGEYEELLRQLQGRLEEASVNIDKLKGMVRSEKAAARSQHARVERLLGENHALKGQLQSMTSALPPSSPAWNGSTNSSSSRQGRAASAGSASLAARRTSMSSADVSREVEHHRAAVFHRVMHSPEPSVSAASVGTRPPATPPLPPPLPHSRQVADRASSPAPSAASAASRRSSTSVLGTSRLASPRLATPTAVPNEVSAVASRQELNKAREEANTARMAERRATEELARISGQCEHLLKEAQDYDTKIQELKKQLATTVGPPEQSWEETHYATLQQAKTQELGKLKEEIIMLRRTSAATMQEKDAELTALRRALDELQSKHTQFVAKQASEAAAQTEVIGAHVNGNRGVAMAGDDASTIFSAYSSNGGGEGNKDGGEDGGRPAPVNDRSLRSVMREFDASAYEASLALMEESLQHQVELSRICSEELQQERQRVRDIRQREVALFKLLAEVERVYRKQIHGLRKDLQEVRSVVEALGSAAQVEVRGAVSSLGLQLDRLFRGKEKQAQEEVRQAQVALSTAHAEELSLLEARFVEQLELQATTHAQEMERLHSEMVMRAESALGLSTIQPADRDSISLDDSLNGDVSAMGGAHASRQQRSVSFASEASDLKPHTSSRQRRHSTLTSVHTSHRSQARTHSTAAGAPAFESVANGVLDALKDDEIIDKNGVQQVLSLAKAHQEPSFAAQAAARSLIAGYLEKFIIAQQDRIHRAMSGADPPRLLPPASGTDYSVFFD